MCVCQGNVYMWDMAIQPTPQPGNSTGVLQLECSYNCRIISRKGDGRVAEAGYSVSGSLCHSLPLPRYNYYTDTAQCTSS